MTTRRRSGALWGLTAGALLLVGGATLAPPLEAQEERTSTASENDQVSGERITLADAIERALLRSPSYAQAEASFANAQADDRVSLGDLFPTLNLTAGSSIASTQRFDANTDRTVSGSANSYNAGLSSNVSIFEGGRRFSERSRTRTGLEAAVANLEDQRFQVRLQTKQMFFGALEQDELVDVARSRLEQALQSLDLVRRRAELGVATTSDSLRARLEWVNSQQALLQAETTTKAARFALGRQVGVPGPVVPVPPETLDPTDLGLSREEAVVEAESASPSVRASFSAAESSGAAVRSAKAAWLPNLRLSGSYNWNNSDFALTDGLTSWNLRFNVAYPLFNGFSRESNIARARESQRVAQTQAQDAQLAARQQADAAFDILRTSEEAILIAREAQIVAEEDLRVVRERYRLGVATILDLVASQVALDQAGTDLVTARYNYLLARAQLEAILGREL